MNIVNSQIIIMIKLKPKVIKLMSDYKFELVSIPNPALLLALFLDLL